MNSLSIKAVKKELLSFIPEQYKAFSGLNAEDLLLTLPLITAAEKIIFINQNLYYYRSRPGSIVHSYNPARHQSIKKVHMELEKYIDQWGMEAYHAVHYSREVRGWVECTNRLVINSKRPDMQILKELAEDDYFLKAYNNMDRSALSKREILLGKWLYEKKYFLLLPTIKLLHYAKILKQRLKGKG